MCCFILLFLYSFDVPFNIHTAIIIVPINDTVTCNKPFKSDLKQVVMHCFNIIYLGSASTVLYYPLVLKLPNRNKST
jgi:hypothetical protein